MIFSGDAIVALAYAEPLIACQMAGCWHVFQESLEDPAIDPVVDWASKRAGLARDSGWSAGSAGRILCPRHGELACALVFRSKVENVGATHSVFEAQAAYDSNWPLADTDGSNIFLKS